MDTSQPISPLLLFGRLIIIVVFLLLLVIGGSRRLEVAIGQPETVYTTWLGLRTVTLTLVPQLPGDHGAVAIFIKVDGRYIGKLESQYNYDTLMNISAGSMHWNWVDHDWVPDVIVTTSMAGDSYCIGSQSGRLFLIDD